ncbi:MAG TPA: hypothetical protein VMZ50_00450, partial [Phycisphaerae bacterium]|nr:hypothetical protein [Phycisphaerae bacterium]
MVTQYDYDGYGRVSKVRDNKGKYTKNVFDTKGRRTYVIENYAAWGPPEDPNGPGDRASDVNRITKYVYNSADQLV